MSHGDNRNQTNVFFLFLTCMLHDFLEEICMAGGTVLVYLFCTSPDDASLKGGRVMCEGKFFFGMCEPKMFCMSYFKQI